MVFLHYYKLQNENDINKAYYFTFESKNEFGVRINRSVHSNSSLYTS